MVSSGGFSLGGDSGGEYIQGLTPRISNLYLSSLFACLDVTFLLSSLAAYLKTHSQLVLHAGPPWSLVKPLPAGVQLNSVLLSSA